MVNSPLYKSYSREIAKLFCKDDSNKVLCEAGIISRLNTYLNDFTYPYFLSKLNSGRQYITQLEAFQNKGFRIVLTDLITGDRSTAWWDIPYNYPYLGQLPGKLLAHQYNIISENKTFTEANKSDVRITHNPTKQTYGLTFVPQQVPGYTPPTGGGTPGGGTINITPDPVQPSMIPSETGFDFTGLLENPIVLIAAGVALFFLLKD